MSSLSAHSRRAFVAATAALAAAPVATAKNKGKGKGKKKPPAPLAFALVTVSVEPGFDPGAFQCTATGAFFHPASSLQGTVSIQSIVPAEGSADAIRADLTLGVRDSVALELMDGGQDVPYERIAVTFL